MGLASFLRNLGAAENSPESLGPSSKVQSTQCSSVCQDTKKDMELKKRDRVDIAPPEPAISDIDFYEPYVKTEVEKREGWLSSAAKIISTPTEVQRYIQSGGASFKIEDSQCKRSSDEPLLTPSTNSALLHSTLGTTAEGTSTGSGSRGVERLSGVNTTGMDGADIRCKADRGMAEVRDEDGKKRSRESSFGPAKQVKSAAGLQPRPGPSMLSYFKKEFKRNAADPNTSQQSTDSTLCNPTDRNTLWRRGSNEVKASPVVVKAGGHPDDPVELLDSDDEDDAPKLSASEKAFGYRPAQGKMETTAYAHTNTAWLGEMPATDCFIELNDSTGYIKGEAIGLPEDYNAQKVVFEIHHSAIEACYVKYNTGCTSSQDEGLLAFQFVPTFHLHNHLVCHDIPSSSTPCSKTSYSTFNPQPEALNQKSRISSGPMRGTCSSIKSCPSNELPQRDCYNSHQRSLNQVGMRIRTINKSDEHLHSHPSNELLQRHSSDSHLSCLNHRSGTEIKIREHMDEYSQLHPSSNLGMRSQCLVLHLENGIARSKSTFVAKSRRWRHKWKRLVASNSGNVNILECLTQRNPSERIFERMDPPYVPTWWHSNSKFLHNVVYPHESSDAVTVTGEDFKRLAPGEMLNDSLIDVYIKMLQARLPFARLNQLHFFNSFFLNRLKQARAAITGGWDRFLERTEELCIHAEVQRWTQNVDVFSKDLIFIPVHADLHWSLIVLYRPSIEDHSTREEEPTAVIELVSDDDEIAPSDCEHTNRVASNRTAAQAPCPFKLLHLNSLAGNHRDEENAEALRGWLRAEWASSRRNGKREGDWEEGQAGPGTKMRCFPSGSIEEEEEREWVELREQFSPARLPLKKLRVPQQHNCTDCGVYLLRFIEVLCINPQLMLSENMKFTLSEATQMRHTMQKILLGLSDDARDRVQHITHSNVSTPSSINASTPLSIRATPNSVIEMIDLKTPNPENPAFESDAIDQNLVFPTPSSHIPFADFTLFP